MLILGYVLRAPGTPPALRAAIQLPEGALPDFENESLALSPDGRALAFVASVPGGRQLVWVQSLDGAQAQALAGTEGATYPFWAPDGRFIGFFMDGKLRKVPVSGGVVQTLCDAPDGRGASWGKEGVIVFSPTPFGGLHQVSASGGTPVQVTRPEKEEMTHRLPHFLPDGRRLLFFGGGADAEEYGIFALDLESKKITPLVHENSGGQFVRPGFLAFVRDGNLMVQPMDEDDLRTTGEAVPIAEGITFNPSRWAGAFAFSETGLVVYGSGSRARTSLLTWFDLEGKKIGTVGEPAAIIAMALSPDGKRAAAAIRGSGGLMDLWIYDLVRGLGSRFTFGSGVYDSPLWSPDGRQIAYSDNNTGDLLLKATDGASEARRLISGVAANRMATSWSPDGSKIACQIQSASEYDIWILPVAEGPEPYAYVATPAQEVSGRFSPDGRWFSYASNESGRMELYVVPFPGPGGKWQVSSEGSAGGVWTGEGLRIVYRTLEDRLMAVDLTARGANLEIGKPRSIFGGTALRYPAGLTRDGRRLLMAVPAMEAAAPALTLVVNWQVALSQP